MRQNRRAELMAAAIRLVARRGVKAATVRRIAQEAGVTEGAVYRHFASKEDLCQKAYYQIVAEMAVAKEQIAASQAPLRDKFCEWVRVSYEYFDRYPEAFTYVLLTPHTFAEEQNEITTRQGRLLMQLVQQVARRGQMRPMPPAMALCLFTGVLLNVPRLINEGALKAPASQYTDQVAEAIWRIFQLA